MSDEAVKRCLALMKKPTLGVVPIISTTASSPAAPIGGSSPVGRDDFVDLVSDDEKEGRGAELPVAEAVTVVPASIGQQGPPTSLPPTIEERASVDDKGKGTKRAEPFPLIRDVLKRQKVSAPGLDSYVEKSVDRFVASGPSNEDMEAFLEAHKGMHPVAKSLMDAMDPETLAKEAMRAMVLVSLSLGTFGVSLLDD